MLTVSTLLHYYTSIRFDDRMQLAIPRSLAHCLESRTVPVLDDSQ